MKQQEEQIKKLLQLVEEPTLTNALEEQIMQSIYTEQQHNATSTIDTSMRLAIIGTSLSVILLSGLFLYGDTVLRFFDQFLGIPNLSTHLISFSALLILVVFFVQIDPVIRIILDRQYKKHASLGMLKK